MKRLSYMPRQHRIMRIKVLAVRDLGLRSLEKQGTGRRPSEIQRFEKKKIYSIDIYIKTLFSVLK